MTTIRFPQTAIIVSDPRCGETAAFNDISKFKADMLECGWSEQDFDAFMASGPEVYEAEYVCHTTRAGAIYHVDAGRHTYYVVAAGGVPSTEVKLALDLDHEASPEEIEEVGGFLLPPRRLSHDRVFIAPRYQDWSTYPVKNRIDESKGKWIDFADFTDMASVCEETERLRKETGAVWIDVTKIDGFAGLDPLSHGGLEPLWAAHEVLRWLSPQDQKDYAAWLGRTSSQRVYMVSEESVAAWRKGQHHYPPEEES